MGPSLSADLEELGYRAVGDLRDEDPEAMVARLEAKRGRQDPCVLYVFRCAVYYASTRRPDPARLKWWVWKDPAGRARRAR